MMKSNCLVSTPFSCQDNFHTYYDVFSDSITITTVIVTVNEVFIMCLLLKDKRPEVQYKVIYICSAKLGLNETVLK